MSAARVAVVRCDSYDLAAVGIAVSRGLELLGGAGRFVAPGEHIVLKPNLLVASSIEKVVTTHPEIFSAVAREFASAGAALSWGDSPAVGSSESAGRRAGIVDAAERLGIPIADFSTGRQVSFPEGDLIKQFVIAAGVLDADGLITLPRLKTHALTRMTGAVKNQFGCVPGLLKPEFHARMPDADAFSRMLVDLNRLLKPRLAVMDAIVAMEGNGPRSGDPRPVGALLFSDDLVAVDAIGCRIMNLDPALVGTVVWGERLGLGTATDIELVGDELPVVEDFVANRSAHPTTTMGLGSPLGRKLLVPRPHIVAERCTQCGMCVNVCPVEPKAVTFEGGDRSRPPRYDYDACIRCYCCQELCPERAIEVTTPLLGRIIRR